MSRKAGAFAPWYDPMFQHLDVVRVSLKKKTNQKNPRTSKVTGVGFLWLLPVDPFSGQQFGWTFSAVQLGM